MWNRTGLVSEGIIGSASLWTRQILLNRQTPALHRAFAAILGTEDLLVNHDRYGMFRPTQQYPNRTTMTNLHLDMNPWNYIEGVLISYDLLFCFNYELFVLDQDNSDQIDILTSLDYKSDSDWIIENNEPGCAVVGELNVQGLVNLADNSEEDGGFWLVPSFHKYLPQWATERQSLRKQFIRQYRFILLHQGDIPELYAGACHISTRAGSAILWDQRTLHGSKANTSLRPRYAQFFKMFPRQHPGMTDQRQQDRSQAILTKLQQANIDPQTQLTGLGRQLFGLL